MAACGGSIRAGRALMRVLCSGPPCLSSGRRCLFSLPAFVQTVTICFEFPFRTKSVNSRSTRPAAPRSLLPLRRTRPPPAPAVHARQHISTPRRPLFVSYNMLFAVHNVFLASLLATTLHSSPVAAAHSSFTSSHARRSLSTRRTPLAALLQHRGLGDDVGSTGQLLGSTVGDLGDVLGDGVGDVGGLLGGVVGGLLGEDSTTSLVPASSTNIAAAPTASGASSDSASLTTTASNSASTDSASASATASNSTVSASSTLASGSSSVSASLTGSASATATDSSVAALPTSGTDSSVSATATDSASVTDTPSSPASAPTTSVSAATTTSAPFDPIGSLTSQLGSLTSQIGSQASSLGSALSSQFSSFTSAVGHRLGRDLEPDRFCLRHGFVWRHLPAHIDLAAYLD
ncbi:hypothetical protein C8Q79DRAFT_203412 [Trametes meyenii]|nr:hypothetical protein C8Q79DRAFT_203412 [Trametes meyenii]